MTGLLATDKKYNVIYADPPWEFKCWSAKGTGRSAEQHYSVMSLDKLCKLPVRDIAAKDACLFMWAVNSMLPEALQVIEAWGFAFKTVAFTWVKTTKTGKPHFGMGYWTRQSTEMCILATRGKPQPQGHNVRQAVLSQRREHSRKPDEIRGMIERLSCKPDDNKIELFARQSAPGWDVWGNETSKYDAPIIAEELTIQPTLIY